MLLIKYYSIIFKRFKFYVNVSNLKKFLTGMILKLKFNNIGKFYMLLNNRYITTKMGMLKLVDRSRLGRGEFIHISSSLITHKCNLVLNFIKRT